jgi:Arc/MetJ-type ribon-helix-helix transcriptional regulator
MSDTEKITINLGGVDLGKIDLLVEHGHYSTRTDFIKTAIRSQIEKHNIEIQQVIVRESFVIGVLICTRSALEKNREKGEKAKMSVIGMLTVDKNIPVELALQVIESIKVRGILVASDEFKTALADRII